MLHDHLCTAKERRISITMSPKPMRTRFWTQEKERHRQARTRTRTHSLTHQSKIYSYIYGRLTYIYTSREVYIMADIDTSKPITCQTCVCVCYDLYIYLSLGLYQSLHLAKGKALCQTQIVCNSTSN